MRVVHATLRYPPALGGVESYVAQIVTRTRYQAGADGILQTGDRSRFDVRVLTSKLRTHWPPEELAVKELLADPVHVQRLDHSSLPYLAYPWLQALSYYLNHHKPNIVHAHSFWYQPADIAARYAKKHQLPFVFNPYYYNHGPRRKLIWRLYQSSVGRLTFAAADAVIVISPHEQALIEKASLPVKRFVLIPPGVASSDFNSPSPSPFGFSGPILLSVGRLSEDKALNEVIAALPSIFKQFPGIHYAIVGEDFGAKPKLKQQVARLGLGNHVHFLGKLSRPQLIAAYQHADLLIHPSKYEAFGIVLAESLAARTPIIARRTSAIPYVAPHGKTGLLFNSPDQLTKQIIHCLRDKSFRETLGQAGRQHVIKNFTWENSINKLVKLYHELAP